MKRISEGIGTLLASVCAFSLCGSLYGKEALIVPAEKIEAWFTGTLLANPGSITVAGTFDFELFVYSIVKTGSYDKHWHAHFEPHFLTESVQLFTTLGLTEWMDFLAIPGINYNRTQGESSTNIIDFPAGFDFQLFNPYAHTWFPGVRVSILEHFPAGKYQKLDPKKLDTDSTGIGSWGTEFDLVFYKQYHFGGFYFMSTTLTFAYVVNAPVHIKGFNAFGGGFGAHGKVYPGSVFNALFSFEIALSRNWVIAMDSFYSHTNKNRFSGFGGVDDLGDPASVGGPSTETFSFTPSIEYNFNANLGIIAGAWVSAFGRNSGRFAGSIVAFNVTY